MLYSYSAIKLETVEIEVIANDGTLNINILLMYNVYSIPK